MMSRMKDHYESVIKDELVKQFGYTNKMMIPKLEKIVLNMGVKDATQDRKKLDAAANELTSIAGQRCVITKAKKSIAGFKLREEMGIGVKVTLRQERMYEFLDRLINIAMPRIRDFRGVSPKSFDGYGNYAMGIKEHIIFPEIDYDRVEKIRGLDVIIVTTARNNQEGLALLKNFNMPFAK